MELLEYLIQIRGAQAAAEEARTVAGAIGSMGSGAKVAAAQTVAGTTEMSNQLKLTGDRAMAASRVIGSSMKVASTQTVTATAAMSNRVVTLGDRMAVSAAATRSSLMSIGTTANTASGTFGQALTRMRESAAKPINAVVRVATVGAGASAASAAGAAASGGPGSAAQGALAGAQLKEHGGHSAMGFATTGILGGIVGLASLKGMDKAVKSTGEMAIAAMTMHRVMGLTTNAAMQWIAIAQAHGLASNSVGLAFKTLAVQAERATAKTTLSAANIKALALGHAVAAPKISASAAAFKALGISQGEIKAHSHDMGGLLGLVADQLNKMPGGAEKAAIGAKLLGKGFQTLMPLLADGSKGLAEQRKMAAAYGITLGGNPLQNVKKLHEAEVNLKLAQTGLQVQLAEHLAPAMLKVMSAGLQVYKVVKGLVGPAFHWLGGAIKDASHWLSRHRTTALILRDGLILLGGTIATVFAVRRVLKFGESFLTAAGDIKKAAVKILVWLGLMDGKVGSIGSGMDAIPGKSASALGALKTFGVQGVLAVAPLVLKIGGLIGLLATAQAALGQVTGQVATGSPGSPGPNNPSGSLSNMNIGSGGGGAGQGGVDIAGIHIGLPFGLGASGGIVTRRTRAVIGEAGPEAVVPLSRMPGASALPPLTQHRASGWNHGDIVVKIGHHEFVRVLGDTMREQMARGA